MKKNTLLLILIFISCSDKKEFELYKNNLPDSLSVYLTLANEDTIEYSTRLEYNKKALKILLNQNNDSLNRKNLFKVANRFYNLNNFEEYLKVTKIISENSIVAEDNASLAKAYSYLGDYYTNTPKKDSAFLFYTKAEKNYIKLKDNVNLGSTYISISIVKNYENDFIGSELFAVQALNVLRGTAEKSKIYEAYNILGVTSYGLKDYEKAIEYHTKALNLANESNLTAFHEEASSLNNLGGVYQDQNKHKLAISKFKEALKNKQLFLDKPKLYATLIDNLAYSKFKLKDYSQLPDLFFKSLKIRDSLQITSGIIFSKIHLSEFYATNKDTLTAQRFGYEALDLAKKNNSYQDILLALKQIGTVEPEKASYYSSEYIKINDSLQQAERRSKDKFARISFETDEYIIQNDKLEEQNRKIFFSGIIIVLFGALIFVIKSQQSKNKEFLLKQEQQKASEEIYQLILDQQIKFNEGREKEKKRIAKELHDGIMNKLAGIRFNLFILGKKNDPETISKCLDHISEIQSIEKEIRNIAHDLHQDVFASKNDYTELIKTLVKSLDEVTELKIHLELDTKIEWENIPAVIKMHVYRILQESINNSIKHSHAEIITINIIQQNKLLMLEIKDDGYGFNTQQESVSLGIKNIKYRTAEIKGNCNIDSSQKGTSILITIPL